MNRETLDVDVLIVGGGPAGMSAALRLAQLQKEKGGEPLAIAVLEKARETGAHLLSGAVLDPSALRDLVPDFKAKGAPLASEVHHDNVYFLTRTAKLRFPLTPPPMNNHGNYLISLNRFVKWLGGLVEAEGVDVFTGFSASEVLYDGDRVVGIRTGDRGIGKHGERKPAFEPGVDIRAKVTILTDGVRGNLTKALVRRLALDAGRLPQIYAIGIKELWEVPADRLPAGTVIHTMGYPLRMEEFGGGFIYAMPDGVVSIGFVSGLDYRDPMFDPHVTFQHFKRHPLVAPLLEGGQMVRYGAKALPEGGWHTIPRVYTDGALIAGDAAGFVNSMRLKGIHLAMRTGMLAAESAFDAIRAGDLSSARLKSYADAIDAQRRAARALPGSQRAPELHLRPGGRRGVRGPVARHRRLVVSRSDACARGLRAHVQNRGVLSRRTARSRFARAARENRSEAHLRSVDERPLLGHASPRRSALAPHRARHRHLPHAVPHGVREPLHALLPRERLRDGRRRRRHPEAADQPFELRALQDVRHHGSLSDHRLGTARGRGRAAVPGHVERVTDH